MDIKKRIEELTAKFNQVSQQMTQLGALREQIKGQVALLEEQQKEEGGKEPKPKSWKKNK